MKIAIAQIKSLKGDIQSNIERHLQLIKLAILHEADAVFFPELSITGYEPELAKKLAMYVYDNRLDIFQNISSSHGISIGVGLPIPFGNGLHISMIFFQPNKIRPVYSKQLLHSDELPYFVGGDKQILFTVGNKKITPAICYESLQTSHAQQARAFGAEIYLASVAKSQHGISKAEKHYPAIAKEYGMPVLMANCIGPCDNFLAVGKSAVWNKDGILLGQLNETEEGILIFDSETEEVIAKTI